MRTVVVLEQGIPCQAACHRFSTLPWILAMIDEDRDSEGVEGGLGLCISNTFGQLVHKEEVLNGNVQMDLPSGIYSLNIQQVESNVSVTAKVIRR